MKTDSRSRPAASCACPEPGYVLTQCVDILFDSTSEAAAASQRSHASSNVQISAENGATTQLSPSLLLAGRDHDRNDHSSRSYGSELSATCGRRASSASMASSAALWCCVKKDWSCARSALASAGYSLAWLICAHSQDASKPHANIS